MNKKHGLFRISLATTRSRFFSHAPRKISLVLAHPISRSLSLLLRGLVIINKVQYQLFVNVICDILIHPFFYGKVVQVC